MIRETMDLQPHFPNPSETGSVVPDPTRICWTQLLREQAPGVEDQRPPLQRTQSALPIEKLFT